MKCPHCGSLNKDEAKFCKSCGNKLPQGSLAHKDVFTSNSNYNSNNSLESNDTKNKNILIICVAIVICALIVAGAFIYMNSNNDDAVTTVDPVNNTNGTVSTPSAILGGSFSTGSSLNDKSHASIYVGSQYAGQKVKITAIWSRNGVNLNNGNILTKTVDSSGYINFNSAEPFDLYPDCAVVKLYDLNGNLLDTKSVTLSPTSGTQTF